MFNDERINYESGKIYRNGIFIATLVSLIYGILWIIYCVIRNEFNFSLTEIFTVISGVVILVIGESSFRGKDERAAREKHDFYLKSGKIFLSCVLTGYALTIPFSFDYKSGTASELVITLILLGYIYFFWNFKSRDICFNYTFIEENNKTYYKNVFVNIGKLAGVLAIVFSCSLMLDLILHRSIVSFTSIILGYVGSVLGLAFEYLLLSIVEKLSYEEKNKDKLKTGTLITFIFYLLATMLLVVATLIYFGIATSKNDWYLYEYGKLLSMASLVRKQAGQIATVFAAMSLCYFLTQIKKSKIAIKSIKTYLLLSTLGICWNIVTSFVIGFFGPMIYNSTLFFAVLDGLNITAGVITFAGSVASAVMIYGLCKELNMSKVLYSIPIITVVGYCLMIFFNSQTLSLLYAVTDCIIMLSAAIIMLTIFSKHKYEVVEEECHVTD